MKIEFNTMYWDNTPNDIVQSHKTVTEHFGIPVNYYPENTNHGLWMDRVCRQSNSDIIGFFDSDCVPLNYDKIMECVKYIQQSKSFLGVAQVSNHIPPKSHVYAAPAFYLIHKQCWERLQTSFTETRRSDVGEELTYNAEANGIRYRCLYPDTFESEPTEGLWPLGNYGYYGIGTTFAGTVYHLYQARMGQNIALFKTRCEEVVRGVFDNSTHNNSRTFNYKGKIVP